MSTPLAGKIVLITGGSKGIGAAISERLASLGASIAINYSSDSAAANTIVGKIGAKKAIAIKADASTVSGAEAMVKQTVENFGKIDILIPCAGILPIKNLEGTTEEDFDRAYALNVKGPYFLAQVSCPLIPIARGGPELMHCVVESSPSHAFRQHHHPLLHDTMCGFNSRSGVLALQFDQGSY